MAMERSRNLTVFSVINLLAGIWMIICPFAIGASTGARWDDVIFGILVLLFAIGRLANPAARGLSWTSVAFGIWLLISPWVLGWAGSGIHWNNTITGIIVIVFGTMAAREPGMGTGVGESTTQYRRVA
jgi:hypothetical protein